MFGLVFPCEVCCGVDIDQLVLRLPVILASVSIQSVCVIPNTSCVSNLSRDGGFQCIIIIGWNDDAEGMGNLPLCGCCHHHVAIHHLCCDSSHRMRSERHPLCLGTGDDHRARYPHCGSSRAGRLDRAPGPPSSCFQGAPPTTPSACHHGTVSGLDLSQDLAIHCSTGLPVVAQQAWFDAPPGGSQDTTPRGDRAAMPP